MGLRPPYTSEAQRHAAFDPWLHTYNQAKGLWEHHHPEWHPFCSSTLPLADELRHLSGLAAQPDTPTMRSTSTRAKGWSRYWG
jgi:hypothetical protein